MQDENPSVTTDEEATTYDFTKEGFKEQLQKEIGQSMYAGMTEQAKRAKLAEAKAKLARIKKKLQSKSGLSMVKATIEEYRAKIRRQEEAEAANVKEITLDDMLNETGQEEQEERKASSDDRESVFNFDKVIETEVIVSS